MDNTPSANIEPLKLSDYDNWDHLTVETAIFILDQGEKVLTETINAADVLTNRAVNVLQFTLPSIVVVCGFLYSDYAKGLFFHLAILAALSLIIITIVTFPVIHLYKITPLGNEPIKLINDEKVLHEKQHLVFLYNAIKNCQKSIDNNRNKNIQRASHYPNNARTWTYFLSFGVLLRGFPPLMISPV